MNERAHLTDALKSVTDRTPLIARGVVNATKSAQPIAWRKHQLDMAIRRARELYDDLVTQRAALGWSDREGDAA